MKKVGGETKKKPGIVKYAVCIEDVNYFICSLNCGDQEFFYHFQYEKGYNKKVYIPNLKKAIDLPDHISFHKDGKVHLKLKSGEIPDEFRREFQDGVFIPKDGKITPLLIHSLHASDGKYRGIPTIKIEDCNQDGVHIRRNVFEARNGFSIVICLVPDKLCTNDVINSVCNSKFNWLGSQAGIIDAWDGYRIDVFLTNWIIQVYLNGKCYHQYDYSFAYYDLQTIFRDLSCDYFQQPTIIDQAEK